MTPRVRCCNAQLRVDQLRDQLRAERAARFHAEECARRWHARWLAERVARIPEKTA